MRIAHLTNIGQVRNKNQDRYLIDEARGLFVICDGMGGHKAGEVAAQIGIDTLAQFFANKEETSPADDLVSAILEANRLIYLQGRKYEELRDMGTTITVALIRGEFLYVASVGDSSLFVINESGINKITEDHTLAEELVREGLLSARSHSVNRYRHVLTRALGMEETVMVDLRSVVIKEGDYIVMSSDGLTDLVEPEEIERIVKTHENLDLAAERLVDLAMERGGHDNITVILIQMT